MTLMFDSAHENLWMHASSYRIPKDSAQSHTFGHNSISLTWFSTLAANLTFASPLSVLPTLSTTAHALARKTSERCIPGAHFPIHADCCGRVRQNSGRESQLCRPSRLIPVAGRGDGSAKLWQQPPPSPRIKPGNIAYAAAPEAQLLIDIGPSR